MNHVMVLGAVALTAASALSSFAGQSQWWNSPDVQRDLALTKQQVAKIDAIFRSDLPERRRIAGEQEQLERRLGALLCADDADHMTALSPVDQVLPYQPDRNARRTQMSGRVHSMMT